MGQSYLENKACRTGDMVGEWWKKDIKFRFLAGVIRSSSERVFLWSRGQQTLVCGSMFTGLCFLGSCFYATNAELRSCNKHGS